MTEKIPARDARQGRKGLQVFTILVVALALTAVAWVVLEAVWG